MMTIIVPVYIEWNTDPARFPYRQWFYTSDEAGSGNDTSSQAAEEWENAWDIQLRITRRVQDSWDTYGELKLLQSNMPEALMEPEAAFILWNGCALATVTVLPGSSSTDRWLPAAFYAGGYTQPLHRNA